MKSLGFIGCGNMATGMIGGIRDSRPKVVINGFDIAKSNLNKLKKDYSLVPQKSAADVVKTSDIVFLCIKPQSLPDVMPEVAEAFAAEKPQPLLVSILAGTTTDGLGKFLHADSDFGIVSERNVSWKILRLMPNINATIGRSATGGYFGGKFTAAEKKELITLVESVGTFVEFEKEDQLHAVTGLAGSGPAFVLSFIHSLAEGGVLSGLTYDKALELAVETVAGTAALLKESGEHPGSLRNRVTSPGGTTITGIQQMERAGFHGIVMNTVQAASRRSQQLGKITGDTPEK